MSHIIIISSNFINRQPSVGDNLMEGQALLRSNTKVMMLIMANKLYFQFIYHYSPKNKAYAFKNVYHSSYIENAYCYGCLNFGELTCFTFFCFFSRITNSNAVTIPSASLFYFNLPYSGYQKSDPSSVGVGVVPTAKTEGVPSASIRGERLVNFASTPAVCSGLSLAAMGVTRWVKEGGGGGLQGRE